MPYPNNHRSLSPLVYATLAQRDPYEEAGRTNYISNRSSFKILILIDDREDTVLSTTWKILAPTVISKEETTEKTEPRKLGEVRLEDMF